MANRLRRSAVALVLLSSLGAATVHAQKFSIAPQIGFYIPTNDLYEVAGGGEVGKIEAGISFGARLGLWFGNRFGLDVSGNYVPTTWNLESSGSTIESQDAKLFNGAAQAVFYILPRTGLFSLEINGGVGVVSHGGVAFTNSADNTYVSGVLGAGAGIRLGGLMLHAGADLYSYTASYQGSAQTGSELKQKDIQIKFGLGIPFGGK